MTLDQDKAKRVLDHIASGAGGNIKRFLTLEEHDFIMDKMRETGKSYTQTIYDIAYPKSLPLRSASVQ